MSIKRRLNRELFVSFFILGTSTFGGGYAMLSLIEREVVDKKKWLSQDELFDILAVSQATPGAIAINAATYVGKRVSGKRGAILASIGVTLPSFLLIVILYPLLIFAFDNPRFNSIFLGIQVAVVALITNSVLSIFSKGIEGTFAKIVFAIVMLLMILTDINPISLIIFGAVAGFVRSFLGGDR